MNKEIRVPWPGWQIVNTLGRGGYGEVYEIERETSGMKEKAALKIIKLPKDELEIEKDLENGFTWEDVAQKYKELLSNYNKEYNLMTNLKGNSYVVSCEDYSVERQQNGIGYNVYIRMELLTPLMKIMKNKPFTERDVICVAHDICSALVVLEKKNIIHRDIKPDNIMCSDLGTYKLGDFGVSRIMDHDTSGTSIGTHGFAAPEVIHMERYGKSVDIYSLGIVLYWLLNEKRLPLVTKEIAASPSGVQMAIAKRYQGVNFPFPVYGSDSLKRIVMKACSFDSKERYQSAQEMLDDIKQIMIQQANRQKPEKSNFDFDEETEKLISFEPYVTSVANKDAFEQEYSNSAKKEKESAYSWMEEVEQKLEPSIIPAVSERLSKIDMGTSQIIPPSGSGKQLNPYNPTGSGKQLNPYNPTGSGKQQNPYDLQGSGTPGNPYNLNVSSKQNNTHTYSSQSGQLKKNKILQTGEEPISSANPYDPPPLPNNFEKRKSNGLAIGFGVSVFLIIFTVSAFLIYSNYIKDKGPKDTISNDQAQYPETASLSVGDLVQMGAYEQDNNEENGKEPIEWNVLAVEDGKALLFSTYGLNAKQYSTSELEYLWSGSMIRTWLNKTFLSVAFTDSERRKILETKLSTKHRYSGTYFETTDKLFLLSLEDIEQYFGIKMSTYDYHANDALSMYPTDYAKANGAFSTTEQVISEHPDTYDRKYLGCGFWWLRSDGNDPKTVIDVYDDGIINLSGASCTDAELSVRPAMWVKCDS